MGLPLPVSKSIEHILPGRRGFVPLSRSPGPYKQDGGILPISRLNTGRFDRRFRSV
jgi:hypothetical protein